MSSVYYFIKEKVKKWLFTIFKGIYGKQNFEHKGPFRLADKGITRSIDWKMEATQIQVWNKVHI